MLAMPPGPERDGQRGASASWPDRWDSPAARSAAGLLAVLAWTIGSFHRSLWEDEFHSLYHASARGLLGTLASVRGDNHPPLSFLLQKASCALLGESAFALRLPSLMAGLGLYLVFLRLARRLPGAEARGIAPWLAACSSFVFWFVSAARMYAWIALATLGLVECVLAVLEGGRKRWCIAAWVALGLHSHYHFFHHLTLLGVAGLVVYLGWPEQRRGLRSCLLPGLLGCAAFLPWGVYAFWHQLGTGDPPTSSRRGFLVWLESYGHFLFINARTGGALVQHGLALPGVVAGGLLGALGTVRLLRAGRAAPAFVAAVLVLGLLGTSWIYLADLVHPRSGYNLKYLSAFAAPLLLIVAAGVGASRWSRAQGGFLLLAMLVVTIVNVLSPGRQDVRGGVRFVLEHAQPGDAVMVHAWWFRDPERSPTDYGWYARRLDPEGGGPVEIPIARTEEALQHPRVWLIHTSAYRRWVMDLLNERYERVETFPRGPEVTVYLYSSPRS
jgi:4-amino-4-deoxy-L-arabinose transferase-like glycosyltransferase